MRLASIKVGGRSSIAVAVNRGGATSLLPLAAVAEDLPRGMCRFLATGNDAFDVAAQVLREALDGHHAEHLIALDRVAWLPVVPKPRKFLAIGLNYAAHAEETGRQPPEFPTVFNKQSTCTNAHKGEILMPPESSALDYEGELAFVIGKRCRRVERADAASVIAGYTIVNDVSVRDWQRRSPTMMMGKGWDSHGPMGPWLVTPDEAGDPHDLKLRTFVNGELRQEGHTGSLLFDCFELVETLSTAFTLEPGDVVSTGTPSGVGVAFTPPRFLRDGDRVRIEVENIGVLENRVAFESSGET